MPNLPSMVALSNIQHGIEKLEKLSVFPDQYNIWEKYSAPVVATEVSK